MCYTLQAGSCIQLFHKEDECYIVAEGSFGQEDPVTEDGERIMADIRVCD